MGRTDSTSYRKRSHTFKKHRALKGIPMRNIKAVDEMFARNAAVAAMAAANPTSVKPMTASEVAKMLRKSHKTLKVRSFAKRALSTVAENGDPVKQLKQLSKLVKKHLDYLVRKNGEAVTKNDKNAYQNAQGKYDVAVAQIKDELDEKMREFGSTYVSKHGFAGVPTYEDGDNVYEDVENLAEFLSEFKETIEAHAPEMMPQYTAMMRDAVAEIMKVINKSLETVGERKANNVNALAGLFGATL